jgi:hypothetical protein
MYSKIIHKPDTKRNKADFYQTPYHCTRLLLDNEVFDGYILEPACGQGAITKVLAERNLLFGSFDLITTGQDFMRWEEPTDNIITNPPYKLATDFILHAKELASNKIAMLLPLIYLHSRDRYDRLWQDTTFPLSKVMTFISYTWLEADVREDGTAKMGMSVYAWFIWDKNHTGAPTLDWLDNRDFIRAK